MRRTRRSASVLAGLLLLHALALPTAHAATSVRSLGTEALVDTLISGDIQAKLEAANELIERRDPAAVRGLIGALRDKNPVVRKEAALALGAIGDARALDALALTLGDKQSTVADAARNGLALFGRKADKTLVRALGNRNPKAAWRAAQLLALHEDPAGRDTLLDEVKRGSSGERGEALKSLALIDERKALEPLALLTIDIEAKLSSSARQTLNSWIERVPAAAIDLLAVLKKMTDTKVQVALLGVLAASVDPQVVAATVEMARSPHPEVRTAALAALGNRGGARHLDLFLESLRDGDSRVRLAAIMALGQTGASEAAPPLVRIFRSNADPDGLFAVAALTRIGKPAVPAVLPLLHESDPRLRAAAARILGESGDPQAFPDLAKAASDPDREVSLAAIGALGALGDQRAVPLLIGILGSRDPERAETAMAALPELGEPAVAPLIRAFRLRQLAIPPESIAEILARFGDKARAALEELYRTGAPDERRLAILSLAGISGPEVRPILEAALGSAPDEFVRVTAARGLSGQTPPATEALVKSLSDPSPAVRRATVEALGRGADPAAAAPLARCAESSSGELRAAALSALALIGGPVAVETMIKALGDSDPANRIHAVQTLGTLEDRSAVRPLMALLQERDPGLKLAVVEALATIGDTEASPAFVRLLSSDDAALRLAATEALGRAGDVAAIPALAARLQDQDPEFRRQALSALASLVQQVERGTVRLDEKTISFLIALLPRTDISANEAVTVLQASGSQAVPGLLKVIRAASPAMRINAIGALGVIGDKRAVKPLLEILEDPEQKQVRVTVIHALGKLRDPLALTPITRMLNSDQAAIRAAAATALGVMGDDRAVAALLKLQDDPDITVRDNSKKSLLLLTGDRCPLLLALTPFPYAEELLFVLMALLLLVFFLRTWVPPFARLLNNTKRFVSFFARDRVQWWAAFVLGIAALGLFIYSIWCQITNPGLDAVESAYLTNLFLFFLKTFPFFVGGCLVAGIVMRYFTTRWRLPSSMAGACTLGAILPLCSCGVVPLTRAMLSMDIPKRTVIAFLVVTPVLNPFVIFLSWGVIGWQYTLWRIFGTFLVAVLMGFIIERFVPTEETDAASSVCGFCKSCVSKERTSSDSGLINGWRMMVMLHPFIIIGIFLGAAISTWVPISLVTRYLGSDFLGLVLAVIVGVPLYLCTGEEVIFLKPLLDLGLPMGHAVAFTIAANGICVSSIAVLVGVLGKRTTIWVTGLFALLPFLLGLAINTFF